MLKEFFQKNYVFLTGLLGSIGVALDQFLSKAEVDFKVVGFTVFIAILSYFANQWRGKGASVAGIVGTLSAVVATQLQSGAPVSWSQIILSAVAAFLATVAPPPKPAAYEKVQPIAAANEYAEKVQEKVGNVEEKTI